jgi:hypothetical protein
LRAKRKTKVVCLFTFLNVGKPADSSLTFTLEGVGVAVLARWESVLPTVSKSKAENHKVQEEIQPCGN